ncbi:MAG TPA: ABC transporter permease [Nitrospirales bacterium]|nr:ABC transporter permease [Nitrospirales bacterium]HIA14879.1 ABC transporter permease [Nitrospirales bacterium]HIB53843.1 ABC transporter permease [Nitrospirales bacterium]HIC04446.1 ABC transporter permease [Nitrospirales bacterium]HIN32857.1 ABC transporter permease [Nitrospirales bacterium]
MPKLTLLTTLYRSRSLIADLVHKDFVGRYKGSTMGFTWSIITPLLTILIFTFVFSTILKVRFGGGRGADFVVYFLCGMIPWLTFSDALNRSASMIRENAHFVQRIIFPVEILPLAVVLSGMIQLGIGLILLLGVIGVFFTPLTWTVMFVPLLVCLQFLFTIGLAWMIASLGVFVRDTAHAIGLGTQMWMFLTPIIYPAELVPESLKILLVINPMAHLVQGYRLAIIEGTIPDLYGFIVLTCVMAMVAAFGYLFFMRSKPTFADVL